MINKKETIPKQLSKLLNKNKKKPVIFEESKEEKFSISFVGSEEAGSA